ncbi:hypothetical protein MPRF_44300 [Mycolicibacterium parafortuitum]|uniref:2'-5' RNA ligase n=1 Tax=Mycolicibacterium parafortuitum TaxID=39692 RepID=A0A7I7U979_MYCPF|nr:2'-5' RNA ligase family protein [Mycolicibacterium parafortuitum]BBY77531.1 hypothetical protein MPRF_44300 [Mycolicibacterium parafortuitum]
MVHSVELLFDEVSEAALREAWDELARNGIRSLSSHRSESNRPHVTVTVAAELDDAVDASLRRALDRLPLRCVIGAPMLFGGGRATTLVRLVVPSAELLALHEQVHRICVPHMPDGPLPHAAPGQWTPHVTLARRVPAAALPVAVTLPAVTRDLDAAVVGLRHWDGNAKVVHPIG